MRKEYMGEIAVPLLDWFEGGDVKLWDEALPVSCLLSGKCTWLTWSSSSLADSYPLVVVIKFLVPCHFKWVSSHLKMWRIAKTL